MLSRTDANCYRNAPPSPRVGLGGSYAGAAWMKGIGVHSLIVFVLPHDELEARSGGKPAGNMEGDIRDAVTEHGYEQAPRSEAQPAAGNAPHHREQRGHGVEGEISS